MACFKEYGDWLSNPTQKKHILQLTKLHYKKGCVPLQEPGHFSIIFGSNEDLIFLGQAQIGFKTDMQRKEKILKRSKANIGMDTIFLATKEIKYGQKIKVGNN